MKFLSFILALVLAFNAGSQKINTTSPEMALSTKANQALTFCKENDLDTTFCILVDMSIHSGKNRLFVYDFQTNKVVNEGLCSHGCGKAPWGSDQTKTAPVFSNLHESHCSSLGKYKIGTRGYSNWGIHVNYKLHGLEQTNSNAYARQIVLHSWNNVNNEETFPYGAPEGWGCPAISNELMKKLDLKLKQAQKPVLLWMYQEGS